MKTLLKYTLLFSLLFSALYTSNTAHAAKEDYQTELSLGISRLEYSRALDILEDNKDLDISESNVGIQHYFSRVDTTNHPYNEAGFLERVGNLAFFMRPGDLETKTVEANTLIAGGGIEFMEAENPFFAQIIYKNTKVDFDKPGGLEMVQDTYGLGFGLFLEDALLLSIHYQYSELERSRPGLLSTQFKDKLYSIALKQVKKLANARAINIEINIARDEFDKPTENGSNHLGTLSGDYYFNQNMSLGGLLRANRGDDKDNEGKTYGIRSTLFFNPYFSINAGFSRFFAKNAEGEDKKNYFASVALRF